MRVRDAILLGFLVWFVGFAAACSRTDTSAQIVALPALPGQQSDVFTTARPSVLVAVKEHFDIRPVPVQPVDFPHDIHIAKGLTCTQLCHATVERGPVAGLPSVKTCMICHAAIAADRPRIQQISRLAGQGLDLSWQRVYGFTPQAHVRFSHAPHIRAQVACSTCHGEIEKQTVAQRNVDLNMGFCVTCHRANDAPDDCLTCHS